MLDDKYGERRSENVSSYLTQQGSIGVSLRISSEENPQLLPIWMFDKDRSYSYSASDLGIRVCGPRNIRLFAYMEMGMRSNAAVDIPSSAACASMGISFEERFAIVSSPARWTRGERGRRGRVEILPYNGCVGGYVCG